MTWRGKAVLHALPRHEANKHNDRPNRQPSSKSRNNLGGGKAVNARGEPALHAQAPGPPPDIARREQLETTLRKLLAQERTWTSRQLSQALAEDGLCLSPRQTRKSLARLGSRYKRTVNTLRHKQKPPEVEKAKRKLEKLKRGRSRSG